MVPVVPSALCVIGDRQIVQSLISQQVHANHDTGVTSPFPDDTVIPVSSSKRLMVQPESIELTGRGVLELALVQNRMCPLCGQRSTPTILLHVMQMILPANRIRI